MQSVYEAAGGLAGLQRLAACWHERVMADEVVSHAFSHGFRTDHTERLAAYWAEALGGPAAYSAGCGDQTSVVQIHSGNGPHEEMDRRAIECFDQAVPEALLAGITNPDVTRLPPVGSIEQWATSVDVLVSPARRSALQAAYRAWAGLG